jgi:hypothetical protein
MKLTKKLNIGAVTLISFASPLALPALAHAQTTEDSIRQGLDKTGTAPSTSVDSVIKTVINILSLVVGVVAVIMIIIGGLKYITSSGDSNNVSSAKNTILYAIIGLVIVALAQVLVRFVLDQV